MEIDARGLIQICFSPKPVLRTRYYLFSIINNRAKNVKTKLKMNTLNFKMNSNEINFMKSL